MMLDGPFGAGFAAPLSSLPMLLALLAAGLWAANLGGRETGRLPLAALAGLVVGAALLEFGFRLPYAGYAVPGAMVLLGALVAFQARLPAGLAIAVAAIAVLWLGQTGAGPAGARPVVWLGFAAGALTALAAGAGFAGMLVQAASTGALRVAGGAIAAVGALVFFGML
ncbi:MAG TPA: HupE/UreJ family protein [Alphaproteobacteria bacterium]|nr:HupE/UreJ family protein [Alphaproteobacteria bacterium]